MLKFGKPILGKDKLDRNKAEELITKFYNYPNVEFVEFPSESFRDQLSGKKTIKDLAEIRSKNLIKLKLERYAGNYNYKFILTSKGKKYLKKTDINYVNYFMASNIIEFDKINGIRLNEGNNKAIVDFQVKRKRITPFGKFENYSENDIVKYKVKLELFDDGWRIINKPNKIYTLKDFPVLNIQH